MMDSEKPTIWALLDDRAGNSTQTLGIAQALGGTIIEKRLYYDQNVRLPNPMRRGVLLGVDVAKSDALDEAPVPDVIIATGRRLAPILRRLKRDFPDAYTVQLMYPDMALKHFDLVVVPEHDQRTDKRLFLTLGAPHRLMKAKIAELAFKCKMKLHLKGEPTAIVIGGTTDRAEMTVSDMEQLWQLMHPLLGLGTLLVTTSRRTPDDVVEWLRAHVTPPHHFLPVGEGDNAYPAILGLAERIIVTADSVSMLSEACITGKAVYAYDDLACMKPKHHRLLEQLCARGHVRRLEAFDMEWKDAPILDEATRVAVFIQAAINSQHA